MWQANVPRLRETNQRPGSERLFLCLRRKDQPAHPIRRADAEGGCVMPGLTRAQYKALYRAISKFQINSTSEIHINRFPDCLPYHQADLEHATEALRVLEALPLDTANWIETMEKKAA
jgi:hypothetical protein